MIVILHVKTISYKQLPKNLMIEVSLKERIEAMERENIGERVLPIRPEELLAEKIEIIPNEVFTVFNALIAENARRGEATVNQFDAVGRLVEMGFDRQEIYKKKWLDIEEIYRAAGWTVIFDKPGYNESYDPFFVFTAPK